MHLFKKNPVLLNLLKRNGTSSNLLFTLLSYILQEIERIVLETIYNYLFKKNKVPGNELVLCFDGVMILKSSYEDGLLEDIQAEITTKTGSFLVLVIKLMDQVIQFKDTDLLKPIKTFEQVASEFELTKCKIVRTIKYICDKFGEITEYSHGQLTNSYQHISCLNEFGNNVLFVKCWTEINDEIRKY